MSTETAQFIGMNKGVSIALVVVLLSGAGAFWQQASALREDFTQESHAIRVEFGTRLTKLETLLERVLPSISDDLSTINTNVAIVPTMNQRVISLEQTVRDQQQVIEELRRR